MLRPLAAVTRTWTPPTPRAGDPLGTVAFVWRDLVGPEIARHARPSAVDGATLVVTVRSGAWSNQLAFLSEDLARKVAALPGLGAVARLRLRVGRIGSPERERSVRSSPPTAATTLGPFAPLPAEAEAAEALARLRASVGRLRALRAARCARCGTPLGAPGTCAPCAEVRAVARRTILDRALFEMPWLRREDLAALPGVDSDEYDRARERLLLRWWATLERARRERRVGPRERAIASSYVLLHAQLPPEQLTPAVMRNLLGGELAALLEGAERSDPLANAPGR